MEEACRNLLTCLDALTGVTRFNIIMDIIVHPGPVEQLVDGGIGALDAWVSCNWDVMVVMEDLCSKWSFWDADVGLIISKDAILP